MSLRVFHQCLKAQTNPSVILSDPLKICYKAHHKHRLLFGFPLSKMYFIHPEGLKLFLPRKYLQSLVISFETLPVYSVCGLYL